MWLRGFLTKTTHTGHLISRNLRYFPGSRQDDHIPESTSGRPPRLAESLGKAAATPRATPTHRLAAPEPRGAALEPPGAPSGRHLGPRLGLRDGPDARRWQSGQKRSPRRDAGRRDRACALSARPHHAPEWCYSPRPRARACRRVQRSQRPPRTSRQPSQEPPMMTRDGLVTESACVDADSDDQYGSCGAWVGAGCRTHGMPRAAQRANPQTGDSASVHGTDICGQGAPRMGGDRAAGEVGDGSGGGGGDGPGVHNGNSALGGDDSAVGRT
jgi:hypothetical protein